MGIGLLLPRASCARAKEGSSTAPLSKATPTTRYNVQTNPWPPSELSDDGNRHSHVVQPASHRPDQCAGREDGSSRSMAGVLPASGASGPRRPPTRRLAPSPGRRRAALLPQQAYPRLSRLKNAAILSDINSSTTRLVIAHKKGINALLASGGGSSTGSSYRA